MLEVGEEGRADGGEGARPNVRGGRGRRVARVNRLRVGSWNIGTLQGKSIKLVKILRKRKINIACVQETNERRRNEVGILVDEELRGQVVKVKKISDRLMTVKLIIGGFTLIVCSVYAPQVGLDGEEKMRFWEALDEVVRGVPSS
ncbi:hypothetical protein FXO37_35701 [Capsicum annuum]|nr:hypothetical protein FXO37_35701 [Capsicum annuum]